MSGILSYIMGGGSKPKAIDIPPVEIHNVETNPDKRARSIKYLLKANHVNYAVLYNEDKFHNHNSHVLSSAYLLGANEDQLHAIYNSEIQELEAWRPSPAELIDEDWRVYLGDKRYQRAFVDFFEDKLAMEFAYDWKKEIQHYLFSGQRPLFHGLIGGLGHPLIHLAYAFEMDSREVAMEALCLAAVQYDFFHKYSDDPSYTTPSPLSAKSPLELLIKLSEDKRFSDLPDRVSIFSIKDIFDTHEAEILEYWNGWDLEDPVKQFELSQEAAVALLVATVRPGTHSYDFFIVHLLTSSHAVRILLPFIPQEHHITIVRQWWLLVLAIFITQGRPLPDPDNVNSDLKQRHWTYVEEQALNSPWSKDAHYVKAIRAMKEASRTWGDVHEHYLRAAVTFVDNFKGWKF